MSSPRLTTGTGLPPGRLAAILGAVAAGISVWVGPLVLGPIATVLGIIAEVRGDHWGRWIVLAAVVGTGLGLLISVLPYNFAMS